MNLLHRVLARLRALLRRILGGGDAGMDEVARHLAVHDQALADITAALQAVQAVTPGADGNGTTLPEELTKVHQRLDLLEQHLPELLAHYSGANGAQRRFQRQLDDQLTRSENLAASIHELWERIEFVRREVMFEMRYHGGSSAAPDSVPAVDPKVVDEEKVAQAKEAGELRLNLGCGHLPMDGYVNVDMREMPGVDVVAPVDALPFAEGEVDEVFSAHLLEHFPEEELKRRLLPYWFGLLRPGGTFRAVVPDGAAMLDGYAAGEIPFQDLRSVLYGGQEYEGDFHHTLLTAETLGALLEGAGFTGVEVEASGRRNDICLELQLSARRPG